MIPAGTGDIVEIIQFVMEGPNVNGPLQWHKSKSIPERKDWGLDWRKYRKCVMVAVFVVSVTC